MPGSLARKQPPRDITYWIAFLATLQLIVTLLMATMEIGNTIVDAYNANLYAGLWSFPFMLAATIATYVSVSAKLTQAKTMIALVCQCIATFVVLIALGFFVLLIVTGFNQCIGFQCGLSFYYTTNFNNTSLSDSYYLLKKICISCELACATIFLIVAVIYIRIFIVTLKKQPHFQRQKVKPLVKGSVSLRAPWGTSYPFQPLSVLSDSSYNSNGEQIIHQPSRIAALNPSAKQICPKCGHMSPYQPQEDTVQCSKCGYVSNLVQYARV